MQSVSKVFLRTLALFLAFLLGFLTCIGGIFGACFFVYEKVSFDTINDNFTKLDTSEFFDRDSAEVVLTALSIKEMIKEGKTLSELGESVNIDLLVDRYGLIIKEDIGKFLSDDLRKLPLLKLFSTEGIDSVLKAVTVGKIFDYDHVPNPDYTEGSDEPEYIWTKDGERVTGINGKLADYTLYRLINEGINVSEFTSGLTVASLLNLKSRDDLPVYLSHNGVLTPINDIEPIKIWYNSDGTLTDKIMSAVADTEILKIGERIETVQIADVIGYTFYNGDYYSCDVGVLDGNDIIKIKKSDAITAEFAGLSINDISDGGLDDKVSDIELATLLGYTHGSDGKYYDDDGNEITGIMAVLADDKLGDISNSVGSIKVGEVSGYTLVDGVWYESYDENDSSKCIPATGVLATMADLTVDELTEESKLTGKIETISIADALGYTLNEEDGKYYKDGSQMSGVMAVVADTPIKDLQSKIDSSKTGELMGYEEKDGVWYSGVDEHGNPKPVHPIMNKVASTGFSELNDLPGNLHLGDVIPMDDREKGMISLIDPATSLDDIPEAVDDTFNTTTLAKLVEAEVITFEPLIIEGVVVMTPEQRAEAFCKTEVAEWTMPDVMEHLFSYSMSTQSNDSGN